MLKCYAYLPKKTNLLTNGHQSTGQIVLLYRRSGYCFWEKEFEIISPKKDTKGSRKFSADDVKKLQLIYHLVKEQGFTLEGARQRLKDEKQKTLSNFEIVAKLEKVKRELVALKEAMDN